MTPSRILRSASHVRALVVGDICLDRWCRYDPALSEPSRETGIPRRAVVTSRCTPGAGGTVACNLQSLGVGGVSVLGAVGTDGASHDLRTALTERGIDATHLFGDSRLATFTYTKLINSATGEEDAPRVDHVNVAPLPEGLQGRLAQRFTFVRDLYDVVVIADQAETPEGGTVTPVLRDTFCDAARHGTRTAILGDSRARAEHFRHCVMVPNEDEAAAASRRVLGTVDMERLQSLIGGPALVVTAAERGAWVARAGQSRLLEAPTAPRVVDVCGAGDSMSAGMAVALATGVPIEPAVRFGMLVASVTVGMRGTGTATPDEVLAVAESNAWHSLDFP